MPRNGAGAYNLSDTLTAQTDATAEEVNAIFQDIADALSGSLAADGQKAPTGNLPMAGYVHTGVGSAAARTQYLSAGQAQDSSVVWGGTAGGTATDLTCTLAPAITAYVPGGRVVLIAASDATAAATTIAVNGLATKSIKVWGADPLAKHWLAGDVLDLYYDGTNYQLINPRNSYLGAGLTVGAGADQTSGNVLASGSVTAASVAAGTINATTTFQRAGTAIPHQIRATPLLQPLGAASAAITFAHGRSSAPKREDVSFRYKCIDAGGEHGYAQNEYADVFTFANAGGNIYGIVLESIDGTNVILRIGDAGALVMNKTTKSAGTPTGAKWNIELVVLYS